MTTYRILALDPGGTTGWTKCVPYPERPPVWSFGQLGPGDHHRELWDLLDHKMWLPGRGDIVICEGFDNRADPAAELVSLEYIGVVKHWSQSRNRALKADVRFPLAAEKRFTDDRKLKALKIYQRGMRHANDASRHLVKYLVNDLEYGPILDQLHEGLR